MKEKIKDFDTLVKSYAHQKMKFPITFILTLLVTIAFAQIDGKIIKKQAELMASSLLQDDYETLMKFTHPKIIEMMGGKEQVISLIKNGRVEMKQQNITFEKVIIGEPSQSVKAGREIHCLIPQTIFMRVPNGKIKSDTYLLAVSQDKGSHWFFLDTRELSIDNIKSVLPNYNADLKIPAKKEPQFIAD